MENCAYLRKNPGYAPEVVWLCDMMVYTLFQNGQHFSILLCFCKLALVALFLNSNFNRIFSLIGTSRADLQGNKRVQNCGHFGIRCTKA